MSCPNVIIPTTKIRWHSSPASPHKVWWQKVWVVQKISNRQTQWLQPSNFVTGNMKLLRWLSHIQVQNSTQINPFRYVPVTQSILSIILLIHVKTIQLHPARINQSNTNICCNNKSPGEIKRREASWTLTKKLTQKRSRAGRWSWARQRVGLLLLQLFPNGRATDIVFVTLSCI